MSRERLNFFIKDKRYSLLLGFFPSVFADESGQVTAISGFAAESIAGASVFAVGNELSDCGGHGFFLFDIVEFVVHF